MKFASLKEVLPELRENLSDKEWVILREECAVSGIRLDESALAYGSKFLLAKYFFMAGLEAAKN